MKCSHEQGIQKPTLTVLIGSGLSEGMGLPGTDKLTQAVRSIGPYFQGSPGNVLTIGDAFWRMASAYYNRPNFETLIHLCETVMANPGKSWLGLPDFRKPAYAAFMNPMPQWEALIEEFSQDRYGREKYIDFILGVIAENLIVASRSTSEKKLEQINYFFSSLRKHFRLVVATLNYDELVDKSLHSFIDGFSEDSSFYPKLLQSRDNNLLLHLHGSVCFGMNSPPNTPPQIIKTSSDTSSRRGLCYVSQSGEPVFVGPMISGLRKTDKLLSPPYSHYHQAFTRSLSENPYLLIIGYGWLDAYINSWIWEMPKIHGEQRRIAIIAKRSKGETFRDNWGLFLAANEITPLIGMDATNAVSELDTITQKRVWIGHQQAHLFVDGFPLNKTSTASLLRYLKTGESGDSNLKSLTNASQAVHITG